MLRRSRLGERAFGVLDGWRGMWGASVCDDGGEGETDGQAADEQDGHSTEGGGGREKEIHRVRTVEKIKREEEKEREGVARSAAVLCGREQRA